MGPCCEQTHAAFEVGLSLGQGQGAYSGWSDVVVSSQLRLCHTCIIDVILSDTILIAQAIKALSDTILIAQAIKALPDTILIAQAIKALSDTIDSTGHITRYHTDSTGHQGIIRYHTDSISQKSTWLTKRVSVMIKITMRFHHSLICTRKSCTKPHRNPLSTKLPLVSPGSLNHAIFSFNHATI